MITKDILKSIEIIKKQNLQSKTFEKLKNDSKVVFYALNGASNIGFSKEND